MRHYLIALLLVCLCTAVFGQSQSPRLVSLFDKADSNGVTVDFEFDSSVRTYTGTTSNWTLTKQGTTGPIQSMPATLSGATPNIVTVSVPWKELAGADSMSAFVVLVDQNGKTILKTASYSRDLSAYKLITDSQLKIGELQQELAAASISVKNSGDALAACINKVVPTRVDYAGTPDLVTDHEVILTFTTNKPGRLQVFPEGESSREQITPSGTSHRVRFDNLSNGTAYNFRAVVLDLDGKPTDRVVNTGSIQTLSTLSSFVPQIRLIAPAKRSDEIDVQVDLDPEELFRHGIKAATEIDYRPVISQDPLKYGTATILHPLQLDQFNIPKEGLAGSSTYPLTGLQPDTKYSIVVKMVDQYGQREDKGPSEIATLKKPTLLDFTSPVDINITPTGGMTASWTASIAPKEAHFLVLFGPNTSADEKAELNKTSPTEVSITVPVQQMETVLNKTLSGGGTPIIELTMSDGTSTVKREFTFEFAIPNVSKKNSPEAVTDSEIAEAANKLQKAADNPNKKIKITWQDILASGLGIIVRAAI